MDPATEKDREQSFINVTVKSIDGDIIVLETESHEIMRWPLKNIPQPMELGTTLTLELKNGNLSQTQTTITKRKSSTQKDDPAKLQQMYNLLEQLVN